MPYSTTPFDAVLTPKRAPDDAADARQLRFARDACYIALKAAGFIGSTYLMALGLPLLFFLAISQGSIEVFFAQIANIGERFLFADPARQQAFANEVRFGLVAIATLLLIWRLPRFLNDVCDGLRKEKP
jgi:hypothetical protein